MKFKLIYFHPARSSNRGILLLEVEHLEIIESTLEKFKAELHYRLKDWILINIRTNEVKEIKDLEIQRNKGYTSLLFEQFEEPNAICFILK